MNRISAKSDSINASELADAATPPPALKSLSIVIPALNEEQRLPLTLSKVLEWVAARSVEFAEVVVVDDGSADRTASIAESFARSQIPVHVIRNPVNRGKGSAVRTGMLRSRGEWILCSDADLSTPIEHADDLYAAAIQAGASIAIGSRALNRSLVSVRQPRLRECAGRVFNFAVQRLTGLGFEDTQCGFKLFHTDAAKLVFGRQRLDGFSFDVENLFIAKLYRLKTVETPVRWMNAQGSKVSVVQGLRSFMDLLTIRMNHWTGRYRDTSTDCAPRTY